MARARGVFAAAFSDLLDGRLGVDTSALPLLDRTPVLASNLAGIALRLKNTDVSVDRFEREALAAADALERLPYGAIYALTPTGRPKTGYPQPNPPLTERERADEAARERHNVRAVAALFRRFDELLAAEHLLTFGDVLTRATAMLRSHPADCRTLRARWIHAMVDEFQDTNPIQVDFLKALFGDELRPVLVVGDVRQAIYAFNGADPNGIVRVSHDARLRRLPAQRQSAIVSTYPRCRAPQRLPARTLFQPELHNELSAHRGESASIAVRAQLFTGD